MSNILDQFSLKGKIALVTGASYGIGFAIASALSQAGAKIVFNDVNEEKLEKVLPLIKKQALMRTAIYLM